LFNDVEEMERKVFSTEVPTVEEELASSKETEEKKEPLFKLMKTGY
jgi:hypothetical protein